jgi:NAD+ diphosphatase
MLGFHAVADSSEPVRVVGELEDARWFTREEIASGVPLLPPPHAISFVLIADWFDRGGGTPLAVRRSITARTP